MKQEDDMEVEKQLGILIEQGRWITNELTDLKKDVKELHAFKWKILGFASCASIAVTLIIEMFRK